MTSCWKAEPTLRPKFNELAEIFSQIIGKDGVKHFDEMNTENLSTNDDPSTDDND